MKSYLEELDDAQRSAVEHLEGPLLILAGAGSGKTRTLTTRLAHIVATGRAYPSQILCVTFTNKAARQMIERTEAIMGQGAAGEWIGTFHSLAARMLRRHSELIGLERNFTILDPDDQQRVVSQILRDRGHDYSKSTARHLLAIFDRWKDRGLGPDRVTDAEINALSLAEDMPPPHSTYMAYQERLLALNACDFGDLLLHCLTLFRDHAHVMESWQQKFRYILVDEYQDTNIAQYLWLRLLAQKHGNICCVGDDDQSIYAWRGAEVGNILRFDTDFANAQIVRMEHNYRSTQNILEVANALISHNEQRLGKTLWTQGDAGEAVVVAQCFDSEEESRRICTQIVQEQSCGTSANDIAVLVRAGWLMRGFEEQFVQYGIPYTIVGGPRFYERQEIRDALGYYRLVAHPQDDLAFERVVNLPKRGVGPAALQKIREMAQAQGTGMLAGLARLLKTGGFKGKLGAALQEFLEKLSRWKMSWDQGCDLGDWSRQVLEESGYLDYWRAQPELERAARLDNLKELSNAMSEFRGLEEFLEHVSLVMDAEGSGSGPRVTLMTMHAAKGLEFDSVYLAAWEEGVFPSQRGLDATGARGLEEERRLAYVGITRAKKRLHISYAMRRRVHGQWGDGMPSRFIHELPKAAVTFSGAVSERVHMHSFMRGYDKQDSNEKSINSNFYGSNFSPSFAVHSRGSQRGSQSSSQSIRRQPLASFRVGDRVVHETLGCGEVTGLDDDAAYVTFESGAKKSILMSYLKPAP